MPANFALAQLYFSKGENDKALRSYQYVADRGGSEFSEQALTRVCELLMAKGNTKAAMPYLTELENTADIPQNRVYAQQNLMKVYFEQKEYARTLVYADKVLGSSNVDDRIRSDAHVMIARSAMKTGDEATAETAYKEVSKIASGSTAAEALYYDAYFMRTRKEYEASNAVVQKLAKEYATYKEWGGKGLLIMAQNFYALGDAFQATYILDSVIANFVQFPAIVEDAKRELARIKAKEAERNASVNPEGN
jgi:lipopolysaccharide biosynthesis regulator YciM